jgi:hypothetical protein
MKSKKQQAEKGAQCRHLERTTTLIGTDAGYLYLDTSWS